MKAIDVIGNLTLVSVITITFGIGFAAGMIVMEWAWSAVYDTEQIMYSFWEIASILLVGTALLIVAQVGDKAYAAGLKRGQNK